MKTIYHVFSKKLFYHSKDQEKSYILLLGPTRVFVVNIGGTRIHPALRTKPSLSEKINVNLRNVSSEVKVTSLTFRVTHIESQNPLQAKTYSVGYNHDDALSHKK